MPKEKDNTLKALIIEDENQICEVIKNFLEFLGYEADTCNDSYSAREKYKQNEYNLIFLDNYLPDTNGLDLLKKKVFSNEKSYIVLMTGQFSPAEFKEALRVGAHEFLAKPFTFHDIELICHKAKLFSQEKINFYDAVKNIEYSKILFVIKNDVALIKPISKIILRNVVDAGFFENYSMAMLALNEAIVNAIYHGNLEVNSQIKEESFELFEKEIKNRLKISPFKDRKIEIESYFNKEKFVVKIKDQGKGFDWRKNIKNLQFDNKVYGRGLFLINSVFDKITWNDVGNEITLIKFKL